MNKSRSRALSYALVSALLFGGCSSGVHEHYVSPEIQGTASKINLEEVQKAFWDTKGKDFNVWMGAFEKRVNEIYDGSDVVSIDATRDNGKLIVTGYINKLKKDGFQPGDDKLFAIEQTGEAVNNDMPYRVADGGGGTYYNGHHSILDNPILQYMLISHVMGGGGGWGGRYYTPPAQVIVLRGDRDTFRTSPAYQQVKTSNSSYFSRFKTNSAGDLTSKSKFGSSLGSSSSSPTRSLSGLSGSSSSTTGGSSTSSWGGRRSSSFSGSSFGGGLRSRGFGGFRRGR